MQDGVADCPDASDEGESNLKKNNNNKSILFLGWGKMEAFFVLARMLVVCWHFDRILPLKNLFRSSSKEGKHPNRKSRIGK